MNSLTYKEIKDQYRRLEMTQNYLQDKIEDVKTLYAKYSKIVFIGCGSSYSLAKSMAMVTMTKLKKQSVALPAGDLMLRPKEYEKICSGALIVGISRSGSTTEILNACNELKKANINFRVLSISCREGKELAAISDYALEIPWSYDESVCQTSAVSNLYYSVMYITARIAQDEKLLESLETIVEKGDAYLNSIEPIIAEIAKKDWNCGVTLGDASIGGICEEGALAFKEICQLPSNYYPLLDSRHGPMVMINEKTLVIAALSDIENKFEMDLIEDVKKKGAFIITVSAQPCAIEGTTNLSFGTELEYEALGIPFVNAAQLATCYKAEDFGVNPDKPDGLDPWITL